MHFRISHSGFRRQLHSIFSHTSLRDVNLCSRAQDCRRARRCSGLQKRTSERLHEIDRENEMARDGRLFIANVVSFCTVSYHNALPVFLFP